ncbi:MAG: phosphoribosylanthranilate isomerase [Phycisphaerae bacterium]
MIRIKICGITSQADAAAAAEAGADAIGLMLAASPRRLDPPAACTIAQSLPPFVTPVGVFVNAPTSQVRRTAERIGLSVVQLHGDETPEQIAELAPLRVIKAIRLRDRASLEAVSALARAAPPNLAAVLLDSFSPETRGGTGQAFDWQWLAGLTSPDGRIDGLATILAGGLTAENVARAVRIVRPYAVDVSSGVEQAPGKKDHQKVRNFIHAARQVVSQPAPPGPARQ